MAWRGSLLNGVERTGARLLLASQMLDAGVQTVVINVGNDEELESDDVIACQASQQRETT